AHLRRARLLRRIPLSGLRGSRNHVRTRLLERILMAAKAKTDRPDYECDAYVEQKARWKIVQDVRASTEAIRDAKATYLPRFESESLKDWNARVRMTFMNDYYGQTLADHVGLVFAEDPTFERDVPPKMQQLLENADGAGTHWHVFLQDAFEAALDYGHA